MKFSLGTIPTSERPVALTTPTVTVCSSPNGLPMAMAHSPTSMRSESPSFAAMMLSSAGIRITARSVVASVPTIFPATSFLLWNRTVISSAPLMTWRFVRMWPCVSMMTPEPTPERSRSPGGIWPKYWSK